MTTRALHAVLVERTEAQGGRLLELLSAALDGTGPAIAPVDAGLPGLDELLQTLAPDTVEDTGGSTILRSGHKEPVAEGTAVVIGTSGSTGAAKGVELSAAALTCSARASLARVGARPGERWLCCLPLTHVAGLQVLVRSLLGGTEPVLADRAEPRALAASGCAHVSLVPAQLQRLLRWRGGTDAGEPGPLAGFSSVLLGGAAAPRGLVDAARGAGVPVVTTYGMTETCGGCVYDGLPLDGVRVAIGDDGRIRIGGPVLFTRYRPGGYGGAGSPPQGEFGGMGPPQGRFGGTGPAKSGGGLGGVVPPEETQRWFCTGDLGSIDSAGRLAVRGRADDVINTGGHKVVPGEVAAALQACAGVRDAAVVGQPDPEWGERVVAVVVPADPADPPSLKLLCTHVRERLPRYAAPSRMVLVDAVPVLPNGKHDIARLRRELREQTEPDSVT
ncbi:MAG: AMP-binding protein [Streptosporangiaceae bacterium]|nr:AMP-binding protein [Streptosporangiaceae bacterium]